MEWLDAPGFSSLSMRRASHLWTWFGAGRRGGWRLSARDCGRRFGAGARSRGGRSYHL